MQQVLRFTAILAILASSCKQHHDYDQQNKEFMEMLQSTSTQIKYPEGSDNCFLTTSKIYLTRIAPIIADYNYKAVVKEDTIKKTCLVCIYGQMKN